MSLLLCSLVNTTLYNQPSSVAEIDLKVREVIDLRPYTTIFVDTCACTSWQDLSSSSFQPLAEFDLMGGGCTQPVLNCRWQNFFNTLVNPYQRTHRYYWLRVSLQNADDRDSLKGWLQMDVLDSLLLYDQDGLQSAAGLLGELPHGSLNKYQLPVALGPSQVKTYWIRINNLIRFETDQFAIHFQTEQAAYTTQAAQLFYFLLFHGVFFGVITFMVLFSLTQFLLPNLPRHLGMDGEEKERLWSRFWKRRDSAYFYYMIYLLATFFYFWWKFEKANSVVNVLFTPFPDWYYFFEVPLSFFMLMTYIAFVTNFLNTRRQMPGFFRLLRGFNLVLLIYLPVHLLLSVLTGIQTTALVYHFIRIAWLFVGIVVVVRILRGRKANWSIKDGLVYYILTGSLALLLCGLVTLALSTFMEDHYNGVWDIPLIPIQLGVLVELIFFSAGLGFRSNLTIKAQKNEELRALRAQLNPHFISNSLIAIENLVATDQSEEAELYLQRFSRLLREILASSATQLHVISLKQELEMSRKYLQLQKLRFKNFDFTIQVPDNLKELINQLQLPSLVLQPYLENAVEHGLNPKEEGSRRLDIRLTKKDHQLCCCIDDNGVGRAVARELKKHAPRVKEHAGMGMQISAARLRLFEEQYGRSIRVKIIDKKSEEGQALGTRLEIWMTLDSKQI